MIENSSPIIPRYTERPFPVYRYIPFRPGIPLSHNDPDEINSGLKSGVGNASEV